MKSIGHAAPEAAMLAEILELVTALGLEGRFQEHEKGYLLAGPQGRDVLFTARETRFLRPSDRERELAGSLGLVASGLELRTRRGSPNERALLELRAELGRARRDQSLPDGGASAESSWQELVRLANTWFNELEVDAEIVSPEFRYRGTIVGHVERSSGRTLLVRASVRSFLLPLGDELASEPGDETLEAIQALVDAFDPLVVEADALCEKAAALGCYLKRNPQGLVSERGVVSLISPKPLRLLVVREIPEFLRRAAETYLTPLLDTSVYSIAGGGERVEVRRGSAIGVATVRPSSAEVGGERISGDFLGEGAWWREVAEAIERLSAGGRPRGSGLTAELVDAEILPLTLREACLQASEDIRLHRTAAFGTSVNVAIGSVKLTFDPVETVPAGHIVRFRFEDEHGETRGHLRLFGADPLPMAVESRNLFDAARIYACVVLAFAALTVRPEFVNETPGRAARGTRRHGAVSPPADRVRLVQRSASVWSRRTQRVVGGGVFEPLGATRTAHWVVGHVRVLSHGQHASEEAVAAAAAVGIRLRSGETWVRPHVRGLAPDESLSFRWHAPSHVLAALRMPTTRYGGE